MHELYRFRIETDNAQCVMIGVFDAFLFTVAQRLGNKQVVATATKGDKVVAQQRPPTSQSEASYRTASIKAHSDLRYSHLRNNKTPFGSLQSHQTLFMTLAVNLTANWEILGRMLDVDVNTIRMVSVTEQAIEMFRKWLDTNGSRATVAAISTAVYESGPQYWNLLDILYEQTSAI